FRVHHAHPDSVGRTTRSTARARAGSAHARSEFVYPARGEQVLSRQLHVCRIGYVTVANTESLLRRLHREMHIIGSELIQSADFQAVENAQYHERDDTLRRWWNVVNRSGAVSKRERRHEPRPVTPEIVERDGAAGGGEIGCHRARQRALVEVVEPSANEALQR